MKVLVVEDDEASAEALMVLLEEAGYHPFYAPNGHRALELLRDGEQPCVILLDLTMPVLNGWGFREEQLKDAVLARIPVIVCTADALAEKSARAIGAAGWLRKPIDPERLLGVVERLCRRGGAPP